ncbi:MAG: hypothetical protein OXG55_00925 [bacterium]|nr:hypothetical protein [bacterium]
MFVTFIIASLVPAAALVVGVLLRRRSPGLVADLRGIALQTVIIMVVLLAIAGAVAGVLLNRASDVTGELEAADVSATRIDSAVECHRHEMGTGGSAIGGDWNGTAGTCTWTAAAVGINPPDVTNGRCVLVGGTYTPGQTNMKAKCVVTA